MKHMGSFAFEKTTNIGCHTHEVLAGVVNPNDHHWEFLGQMPDMTFTAESLTVYRSNSECHHLVTIWMQVQVLGRASLDTSLEHRAPRFLHSYLLR